MMCGVAGLLEKSNMTKVPGYATTKPARETQSRQYVSAFRRDGSCAWPEDQAFGKSYRAQGY
jgi:hypothetical protein